MGVGVGMSVPGPLQAVPVNGQRGPAHRPRSDQLSLLLLTQGWCLSYLMLLPNSMNHEAALPYSFLSLSLSLESDLPIPVVTL